MTARYMTTGEFPVLLVNSSVS